MNQQQIETIVRSVIEQLNNPHVAANNDSDGIFESLDDAVSAAKQAQKNIHKVALRDQMIEAIRDMTRKHAREFAEMAVAETGFGRVEDKIAKHLLVANKD